MNATSIRKPRRILRKNRQVTSRKHPTIEALEARTLLDSGGPRVVALTPTEVHNVAFDHIDVTFDGPIDGPTFTSQDVSMTGPAGTVTPTGIAPTGGNTYRVSFAPITDRGTYRVAIGPDVSDPTGKRMDQDGDGTGG